MIFGSCNAYVEVKWRSVEVLEILLFSGAKADGLWFLLSEKSSWAESDPQKTPKLMIRLDKLRCWLSCEAQPLDRLASTPIYVCLYRAFALWSRNSSAEI